MAIDDQQKRMSVTGVGRPYLRAHFPGTINEAWRLAAGNVYSGNALGGAPPPGRIMSSLAAGGGLASKGGIAGNSGGLAG